MTESYLLSLITHSRVLGYALIFFGMTFEGDMSLLATAALVRFHYFDPIDMLLVVCSGALFGDTLWFYLGRHFANPNTRFAQWVKRHIKRMPVDVHNGLFHKLLVSKFMYGTHHPFLFSLGAQHVSYGKFFRHQIPAVCVWVSILGSIGFIFADALAHVRHTIKYIEVILLIIVVSYLLFEVLLRSTQHAACDTDTESSTDG